MIITNLPDKVFARGDDWPLIPFQAIADAPPWSATKTYSIGDTAFLQGMAFTCTAPNTNLNPALNPGSWSVGGTPVDISTWTGLEFALFRSNLYTPPSLFVLTLGSGLAKVDAAIGTFTAQVLAVNSILCVISTGSPTFHYWQSHRTDAGSRREIGAGSLPVRA